MNEISRYQNPAESSVVRAWLVKLHSLTAGISSSEEAIDRINLVLEQLQIGRYAESAFTKRSLQHVAAKCKFWPAYGVLCAGLDEYLEAQSSPRFIAAPVIPDHEPPTDDQVLDVAAKLAQHWREQAEDRIAREAAMPQGYASKPLRDVTAKGEVLRAMREARCLVLPDVFEPKWPVQVYGQVSA